LSDLPAGCEATLAVMIAGSLQLRDDL